MHVFTNSQTAADNDGRVQVLKTSMLCTARWFIRHDTVSYVPLVSANIVV